MEKNEIKSIKSEEQKINDPTPLLKEIMNSKDKKMYIITEALESKFSVLLSFLQIIMIT